MALVEGTRQPVSAGAELLDGPDHGPANIDLRLWFPLRWAAVLFIIVGAFLGNVLTGMIGNTNYVADARLLVVGMNITAASRGVPVDSNTIQSILHLARSDSYLIELARRAGVEPDLDVLHRIVDASRPSQSAVVQIEVNTSDQAMAEALGNQLVPTLDDIVNQARQGAIPLLDENGRNSFATENANYQGPLFVDLFHGRPDMSVAPPKKSYNTMVGAGMGLIIMFIVAMGLHARARVTSEEQLDMVLGLRQVATVRRPTLLRRKSNQNYLRGVAMAIDGMLPDGVNSVGLVGSGIPRTRARLTMSLAVAMADALERNVVVVDLDSEQPALSRRLGLVRRLPRRHARLGVSDVVAEGFAPEPLVKPVSRRRLPRDVRGMARRSSSKVYAIGVGSHVGERTVGDESAVVEMIEHLSTHAVVLVSLPRVPGPAAVQGILDTLDVSLLTLLDGWTELAPAQAAAAVVHAISSGRDGFLLLES
jgi:capsular polysaccharide biosynthesis protein